MKKITLIIFLLLVSILSNSCLKDKEYCWNCDGFENSQVFQERYCGYTEDEINVLMNNDNDNKDFLTCHKE
jgi:hypothetical protein